MRVMITGGTGFIGAHTVAALLEAGHEPTLLVRNPERVRRNVGALGVGIEALRLVVGDMADADAVATAVADVEAVIHAAAMVTPLNRSHAQQTSETDVSDTRRVMARAPAAGGCRVVYFWGVAALFCPREPFIHAALPPMTS